MESLEKNFVGDLLVRTSDTMLCVEVVQYTKKFAEVWELCYAYFTNTEFIYKFYSIMTSAGSISYSVEEIENEEKGGKLAIS